MKSRHSFFALSAISLYTVGMAVFYLMAQKMNSMEVSYTEKMTVGLERALEL
jgi:hypothetical protein